MRKIITTTFVTLDGVMQAPGGPEEDTSDGFKWGGWQAAVPMDEMMSSTLMGIMGTPFELRGRSHGSGKYKDNDDPMPP